MGSIMQIRFSDDSRTGLSALTKTLSWSPPFWTRLVVWMVILNNISVVPCPQRRQESNLTELCTNVREAKRRTANVKAMIREAVQQKCHVKMTSVICENVFVSSHPLPAQQSRRPERLKTLHTIESYVCKKTVKDITSSRIYSRKSHR